MDVADIVVVVVGLLVGGKMLNRQIISTILHIEASSVRARAQAAQMLFTSSPT